LSDAVDDKPQGPDQRGLEDQAGHPAREHRVDRFSSNNPDIKPRNIETEHGVENHQHIRNKSKESSLEKRRVLCDKRKEIKFHKRQKHKQNYSFRKTRLETKSIVFPHALQS